MTEQSLPEESIFLQALEIDDDAERVAFVARACGSDARLRGGVEALLRASAQSGDLLDVPDPPGETMEFPAGDDVAGTIIGPYKLLQELGQGGMGVVYMAEQQEPIERRVALKIIKQGMDSRQVIARFEAERQALAMMDHPNIAKVLDAGTVEDGNRGQGTGNYEQGASLSPVSCHLSPFAGQPYFVMELVKGVPIARYCDEQRLTLKQRLELFVPICQAIQHAHQKGIIHRDVKPTNILVALYDGVAMPKVIDFGVAKATGPKLTEKTIFTGFGQLVGTLEYMSPEQAQFNQLDIDTRSDIYSLGVLLYELLTGTTPLDQSRLRTLAFDETLRIIREEEPPKPSTKLSTCDKLPAIAANRGVDPSRLTRQVRGELDWIVMKCLEKDRNRRYETANGLALDLRRYLADEPVEASPPSATYQLRKFVRRNQGLVLAAISVLLSLVGGVVGTTWGLIRAETAWVNAVAAKNAEAERAAGERKAKQDALIAAAAEKKAKEMAELREAETLAVLELVQERAFDVSQTRNDKVLASHEEALALQKAKLGPSNSATLHSMHLLARSYAARNRHADVAKLREEIVAIEKVKYGPDDAGTLATMESLAITYQTLQRYVDALELRREILALRSAKLGPDHRETLRSMQYVAYIYGSLGKYADALKLEQETLEIRRAKLGSDDPDTLRSMYHVAHCLSRLNRGAEAVPLFDELVRRSAGKVVEPDLIPPAILLRMDHFQKARDIAGCRETVEMWEKLNRTDGESLFLSARLRAFTVGAIRAADKSARAARDAVAEADQAMTCLRQALAAGYKYNPQKASFIEFNSLQDREDYRKLIVDLATGTKKD